MSVTLDKPLYVHDCDRCLFLGTWKERDLYACVDNGVLTYVARSASNGPDYVSSSVPSATTKVPALVEARRRYLASLRVKEPTFPQQIAPIMADLLNLGEPTATWHEFDGGGVRYHYPNGYGMSVICTDTSYGGQSGLFEVAVVEHNDTIRGGWRLCYDTPVAGENETHGWLSAPEVRVYAKWIASLGVKP